MSDNHDRPTTHQHIPETCTLLGCREGRVDQVILESIQRTRELVRRELEVERVRQVIWP